MSFQDQDGIILENTGPWGGRKPGRGPENNDDDPQDLDAILRQAQNQFRRTFQDRPPAPEQGFGKTVFLILLVSVAIWVGSGFYRVEPGENAVIMTFGKWTDTKEMPGLGYSLPYPIQDVVKVNVAFDRRIEIGFRDQPLKVSVRSLPQSTTMSEGTMLTGDENIIDIDFIVLWRISDAGKYLFHIRDPETTVKKAAESAMREIIGRTEIQKAMTEARSDIEIKTKELMQKILDDYQAGAVINSVQLLRVDPPEQVVDAFDDVQRARADKERSKNEAETYTNDIVPRARGDAQKILQDANAYKEAVISKAKGDADRFSSVYKAYSESKDITEKRLYLETMQEVLKNSKKIITGDSNASPLLPYLPVAPPALPQSTGDKK